MKKKEEKKEVCTFCQPEKKNIEKSNQQHFYVEFVQMIYIPVYIYTVLNIILESGQMYGWILCCWNFCYM